MELGGAPACSGIGWSGFAMAAARNCLPRMLIWSCNVRTCVLLCRWFVGVVCVQPVMIRRALFCIVCKVLW